MAELQRQIDEAPKDEPPTEFACKASKKKQKEPSLKVQSINGGAKSVCSESSTKDNSSTTPSIWKSGTTKGTKGSNLCVPAASVLMGLLYGARMSRYGLLRPVQSLATYLHQWDADSDDRLHRLCSYVQSTYHWRQVGWMGDDASELGPHLYVDAHFAGCPRTLRSTTGYHLAVEGPWSSMPQIGASARQTALSNSAPEAEFAACHLAHKKAFIPALDLYDKLLPNGYHKVVHEDSQAMIQIAHTGINKTMRWLSRNHGIAIMHLYDHLGNPETKGDTQLVYTWSEWMAADIYTKGFTNKDKLEPCMRTGQCDRPNKPGGGHYPTGKYFQGAKVQSEVAPNKQEASIGFKCHQSGMGQRTSTMASVIKRRGMGMTQNGIGFHYRRQWLECQREWVGQKSGL